MSVTVCVGTLTSHLPLQLNQHGSPVVLYEAPFDNWKSAKWTPYNLENDSNIVQVLSKKGTNNIFRYFANDQPLSEISNFVDLKPFKEVIFSRERFFSVLSQPFDGHYYYSSGGVELLETESLYTKQELEQVTFQTSSQQELGQVNFWFGMKNVTAYTHYDTSHNLHSISYGKKRFILFPPEAYSDLKLYPCLHQFYRQIQMPVNEVLESSTIQKLNGIDITLYPGDVLYIPPYWFHCVITLETTLSVNVWSQSEAFNTMETIYSLPLPFEESWGQELLLKTVDYFWEHLASQLFENTYETLMKEVVVERYAPLVKKFTTKEKNSHFSKIVNLCRDRSLPLSNIPQENMEQIHQNINTLAKMFLTIRKQSVRAINFGNYVEHIAFRIFGFDDVLLIPFYFQQCYN